MVLTLSNVEAAMGGKRLGDYGPGDLREAGETVLKKAFVLYGREPQLFLQGDELGADMAGSFPHLTLAECVLASKAGVAGELGTVRTPSYAAVMQWLEAYDKHPMVADARKIRRARKAEPVEVTPEEGLRRMAELMPRNARERWEGVRVSGSFPRHCMPHASAQIYDWLKEEGLLSIPEADKRESLAKAKAGVGLIDIPFGNIEAGRALTASLAKHLALESWMRRKLARGERLILPEVRRIYN